MNKQELIINFLNAFFKLFQAHIVKITFDKNKTTGVIIWNDTNELQEFTWNIPRNNYNYKSITQLINYLIQKKLVEGDKIIIPKELLIKNLKKSHLNLNKIEDSLILLCSVRIAMVDNDEITDYFLIHF